MKKVLIYNNYPFHYEIIESFIVKYNQILEISDNNVQIYLHVIKDNSFEKYIKDKYSNVIFKKIEDYDYFIDCTLYWTWEHVLDASKNPLVLDTTLNKKKKYISHVISETLQKNPNIYFLSPIAKKNIFNCDVVPFLEKNVKTDIPIFIIQGNFGMGVRDFSLLKKIMETEYNYDYKIKLIGRGKFPKLLDDHKDKIIFKQNLNFIDYHKEFLDCYGIFTLINRYTHDCYYKYKLTSTINYAKGYNLKCILDRNLQKIYNLENAEVYDDIHNVTDAFERTLISFYKNKI